MILALKEYCQKNQLRWVGYLFSLYYLAHKIQLCPQSDVLRLNSDNALPHTPATIGQMHHRALELSSKSDYIRSLSLLNQRSQV